MTAPGARVGASPGAADARRAVRAARASGARLIAIDGPSGAGKSTFADAFLAGRTGRAELVRLDDVYPGWHGLERGADLVARRLVAPWRRGAAGVRDRWDWQAEAAGPAEPVAPGGVLVVEGCGAFAATAGARALRIWVEAREPERRAAALARDGGAYDPFWELWDGQWRRYTARTGASARSADLVVRTHPAIRVPGRASSRDR